MFNYSILFQACITNEISEIIYYPSLFMHSSIKPKSQSTITEITHIFPTMPINYPTKIHNKSRKHLPLSSIIISKHLIHKL